MLKYQFLLLFFISLILVQCNNNKDLEPYDLLIVNGSVIDLDTGVFSKSDIKIYQGKITEIIPQKERTFQNHSPGSSGQVIDAEGKFIIPGLWDNHAHFRGGDGLLAENEKFLEQYLKYGITGVRDAGGDLTTAIRVWQQKTIENPLFGPTIFTSGPKIDGPNARWPGSLEVSDAKSIQKALDSLMSLQVDFVKLYESTLSGESYLETIKEASKRGLQTSGHMPFDSSLAETIKAGIGGIEHLYYIVKGCSSKEDEITLAVKEKRMGFWEALPILLESYDETKAKNMFVLLKEHDVFVVPTLHIGETLSSLDNTDHSQDIGLNSIGPGIQKTYEGRIKSALNASDKEKVDRKALQSFFSQLTLNLSVNHVALLAGSDNGAFNSYIYPGSSLHEELVAMVKAGLSPLEALRTSIVNGPRFLRVQDQYGSISLGKNADLLLLEHNPLKNITHTKEIYKVIKGGLVFK